MEQTKTLIGRYAPDFEIPGIDDDVHHLAKYLEIYQAVGVVFLSHQCPQVDQSLDLLKQIQSRFEQQGFTLVGINPNDATLSPTDSFEQMKQFAREHTLNFPYLRDVTQDVARGFKATMTPTTFLIDRESVVRYSGNLNHLEAAIAHLLQGQPIAEAATEVAGSPIRWRP